jgi:glycerol uptake facilitator-like aquaporin
MLGVLVSGGVSGGHLNPAVTVAVATLGKLPWRKVGARPNNIGGCCQ